MNATTSMFDGYAGEILKEEYMDYHGLSNEDMAKKLASKLRQ